MRNASLALVAVVLGGLAGCSTPVSRVADTAPNVVSTHITKYEDSSVNEAASAYVAHYKNTIETSLVEHRYKGDLAYKHLSAEACFDSRASRLLRVELTREEKDALVLSYVSQEKMRQYEALSQGYFPRINGLEMFTCDNAGLKVTQNMVKH